MNTTINLSMAIVLAVLYSVGFYLLMQRSLMRILIGIVVLYFEGGRTFDILALMGQDYAFLVQAWVFLAFLVAFAVKVPMVPFHTWLPDAHAQAPTAGSVDLAGILLKTAAYGMLRFALPLFPEASQAFAPVAMISASPV